ncbi:hypothetical protein C5167_034197 [Papaver somniferum]|uniref:Uncharacterized protein n=1 Tax=Papaver somniferum TaxID=3469 RepID=A0A4Y7KGB4_PAPSO|nr:hypothetical protein C5167_034197 [Papaver somniferum]
MGMPAPKNQKLLKSSKYLLWMEE